VVAGRAIVNGQAVDLADAVLPVTDAGVARGDGAFETVGVWSGRPFRLGDHLERLACSLRAVGLPEPALDVLAAEAARLCDDLGRVDAALRLYVTASGTRVLTLTDPPVRKEPRNLVVQVAPWVVPVGVSPLAGAKTMSYLPNMAATRLAQAAGADDALLVNTDGIVLESPTGCVLWVDDGTVHAVDVDLGIVDSISRRTLLDLAGAEGLAVRVGAWPVAAVERAAEVWVCSSLRPLVTVRRIGDVVLPADTPLGDRMGAALDRLRRAA
jgi:branched-subunit amino acid aminotransferase/4-amino-4-deoxychorismate lyase